MPLTHSDAKHAGILLDRLSSKLPLGLLPRLTHELDGLQKFIEETTEYLDDIEQFIPPSEKQIQD